MFREWIDARDGRVWLVQAFYAKSEGPFGRPRAVPRMITYRLPADVDRPASEIRSVSLAGTEATELHDLTDQQLADLLDAANAVDPGSEPDPDGD